MKKNGTKTIKELLGKAMDPAFWAQVREKDCYFILPEGTKQFIVVIS